MNLKALIKTAVRIAPQIIAAAPLVITVVKPIVKGKAKPAVPGRYRP